MSSPKPHPAEVIRTAAKAVGNALLQHPKYALVGGSACAVLGNQRATHDVDFVVPRGQTPSARQLLRESSRFEVEPRTNHTTIQVGVERVDIEILTPPALFQEEFHQATEIVTIGNVRVLKPALILNSKYILFILDFFARCPEHRPGPSEVPNANKEFAYSFSQRYGTRECWTRAGYDWQAGCFN